MRPPVIGSIAGVKVLGRHYRNGLNKKINCLFIYINNKTNRLTLSSTAYLFRGTSVFRSRITRTLSLLPLIYFNTTDQMDEWLPRERFHLQPADKGQRLFPPVAGSMAFFWPLVRGITCDDSYYAHHYGSEQCNSSIHSRYDSVRSKPAITHWNDGLLRSLPCCGVIRCWSHTPLMQSALASRAS